MASENISKSVAKQLETQRVVDAARSVIATKGIAGMSLRSVAEAAATSVGSISYRIGDRAALIAAVLDREIELAAAARMEWRDRIGNHDPVASGILPDLICEWLDQGAGSRRTSAIVVCELALTAGREPYALPAIATLFEEGRDCGAICWPLRRKGRGWRASSPATVSMNRSFPFSLRMSRIIGCCGIQP
ncbi:TetR/AcrR family transcriptional regulator [Novosphingobium resinovorum]